MSDTTNPKLLRENPELFLAILQNAVEDVVSSVSNTTLTNSTVQDPDSGLVTILQEKFKTSVLESVDAMWNELEIPQKMSLLCQLEQRYPADFVAWRPTTGEIPLTALKGRHLEDAKDRLVYKIEKQRAENEEIKKVLLVKASALKASYTTITEGEKRLSDLFAKFEALTRSN